MNNKIFGLVSASVIALGIVAATSASAESPREPGSAYVSNIGHSMPGVATAGEDRECSFGKMRGQMSDGDYGQMHGKMRGQMSDGDYGKMHGKMRQ